MRTFKQVCSEIADHIEKVGWIQGAAYKFTPGRRCDESPCCVIGALNITCRDNDEFFTVRRCLQACLGEPIATWNDEPGRTKEEVIAKLREIAAE